MNWSPRAGVAIGVAPEGRGDPARRLRQVRAAHAAQRRGVSVVRAAHGLAVRRRRRAARPARSPSPTSSTPICGRPKRYVGNVEWNQRFGRRLLLKLAFLQRHGSHEYIVSPDPAAGALRLSSTGTSRYRELEATTRYLGGERRDLTALVRLGAEGPPISTTTISSSATCATRSSAPTRTT